MIYSSPRTHQKSLLNHNLRRLTVAALVAALSPQVHAGEATELVKRDTERIIALLEESEIENPKQRGDLRRKIAEIADERIDWASLSRSCLGRYWRDRNNEERAEYVMLFTQFVEHNYVDSIIDNFTELMNISYADERTEGEVALVRLKLITKDNLEFPIAYRLKIGRQSAEWEIYDILIEGVSLVKNYRSQFSEILRKSSFAALMKRLRERIAEQSD